MVEWKVIENAARGFLTTKNLAEAEKVIASGLKSFPNQINLLVVASDVYRASINHEKSLEHAKLLVKYYPHQPNGYIRSAQDLVALGKKLEAQKIIQDGIKVISGNLYLLLVARDIFRRSGNREKCLKYSQDLILYHPNDWRGYGRAAQDLIALDQFKEAQKQIQAGLAKIPNQIDILTIATKVYRASGDHEKSLEYSELLITHHPDYWDGYGLAAQDLIALEQFEEAQKKIQTGLAKIPNQIDLLTIATEVYRISGDRKKSLEYSEILITHHPDNWNGYGLAAQDLIALKRFEEAQIIINVGLERVPNQIDFLTIVTEVYRISGDRKKSLEYSEILITHHPDNWNGYGLAAQDLVALKRFEEAQIKINMGLEKTPNQIDILTIASEVYRISGDRKKSLEYSELLITHHPDNWNGYGLAAQDLIALKRFEEAQKKIQAGLEKFSKKSELIAIQQYILRLTARSNDLAKFKLTQPSKVALAGNCQVVPFQQWITQSFPETQVSTLPEYQFLQHQEDVSSWIQDAKESEMIWMINLIDGYKGLDFGSKRVEYLAGKKVRIYPNFYATLFFPFMGYNKLDNGIETPFFGPYHDYFAHRLSIETQQTIDKILQLIETDGFIDYGQIVLKNALDSFAEFAKRFPQLVRIVSADCSLLLGLTINHPSTRFLNSTYKEIWTNQLNLPPDLFVPIEQGMKYFSDISLHIPSFVVRHIFNDSLPSNTPWRLPENLDDILRHPQVLPAKTYAHKLRSQVKWYKINSFAYPESNRSAINANLFFEQLITSSIQNY